MGTNCPNFRESFFEMQVKMQVKKSKKQVSLQIIKLSRVPTWESEDSGSSLREGFTESSGGTRAESEDSRSRLPKGSGEASGGTVTKTQSHDASRLPEASEQSIAQASGETKQLSQRRL